MLWVMVCLLYTSILTSGRIEQQSYRSCMGLLKLAEKYSPEKLEQVCAKALSYSGKPSYKSIKNLLADVYKRQIQWYNFQRTI